MVDLALLQTVSYIAGALGARALLTSTFIYICQGEIYTNQTTIFAIEGDTHAKFNNILELTVLGGIFSSWSLVNFGIIYPQNV